MKRKIFAFLLASVLLASVLSLTVSAAPGQITGVRLTENGRLYFDEYEGADIYWLAVDIYSYPISSGGELNVFNEPGTYEIAVEGYTVTEEEPGGDEMVAIWEGKIEYDGTTYKLVSSDPGSDPAPESANPAAAQAASGGTLVLTVAVVALAVLCAVLICVVILLAVLLARAKMKTGGGSPENK